MARDPKQQHKQQVGRQHQKSDGVHGYCLACCERTDHADLVNVHGDIEVYGRDHAYCKECVALLFELALKNESVFPPKCCPQSKLPLKLVEKFLTRELIDGYHAKLEEYASGKRLYCSIPTCSAFIPRDSQEEGTGVCPTCLTLVCVSCGHTSHEGACQVDEGLTLLLETAGQTGWQTCKACFRMVERSAGCNKISCMCGSKFCYICGRQWRECGCGTWDEWLLLERAQTLIDSDVHDSIMPEKPDPGHLLAVRNFLQEQPICDDEHHEWTRIEEPSTCELCAYPAPQFYYICESCGMIMCNWCSHGMKLVSLHKRARWLEAREMKLKGLKRAPGPNRFRGASRWVRATENEYRTYTTAFRKRKDR